MRDCWSLTSCFSWTLGSLSKCGQLKSSIGITLIDVLQNWLNWFHFLFLEGGLLIILIDYMIFLSPFLGVTRMSMSTTTAQLHSTKPQLRFCTDLNPACSMSEIHDGEDLWQWSQLEIRLNPFCWSTIPQKQFINSIHLKWMIESGLLCMKVFIVKAALKIGQGKYLLLILLWKLNLELKNLNI